MSSIFPHDVISFWWRAGKSKWFAKDPDFDAEVRYRFLDIHMAVAARCHDDWAKFAEGALALVLLTDQFPRNIFRGTAHMYATEPLARFYARGALTAGHIKRVEKKLRLFFCLPFAHSEDLADQDLSVAFNAELGQPWLSHAEGHRDIIRRFGRFPDRNPILLRDTTPDEAAFLEDRRFDDGREWKSLTA